MIYKIILVGRLEFGSEKTLNKVLQMYQFRVENFYKLDLLIKEDVFDHENFYLNVPRIVCHSDNKNWNNTIKLMEYLAQFAVAGAFMMWKIDESGDKKKVSSVLIEPKTDKAAVQEFLKGRELTETKGKESEAMEALNRAIDKYERHALAYERRGYVNLQLRNYNDAIYDFSKSIDLNPNNSDPYFGRALVNINKKNYETAIMDFEEAIKNSIPLQPLYWKAGRMKGEVLLKIENFELALKEFKFFLARKFDNEDPNFPYRKSAYYNYGLCLIETENYAEALKAFENALACEVGKDLVSDAEILVNHGLALHRSGKNGFKKDWKEAASMGSKHAEELLATHN